MTRPGWVAAAVALIAFGLLSAAAWPLGGLRFPVVMAAAWVLAKACVAVGRRAASTDTEEAGQ